MNRHPDDKLFQIVKLKHFSQNIFEEYEFPELLPEVGTSKYKLVNESSRNKSNTKFHT